MLPHQDQVRQHNPQQAAQQHVFHAPFMAQAPPGYAPVYHQHLHQHQHQHHRQQEQYAANDASDPHVRSPQPSSIERPPPHGAAAPAGTFHLFNPDAAGGGSHPVTFVLNGPPPHAPPPPQHGFVGHAQPNRQHDPHVQHVQYPQHHPSPQQFHPHHFASLAHQQSTPIQQPQYVHLYGHQPVLLHAYPEGALPPSVSAGGPFQQHPVAGNRVAGNASSMRQPAPRARQHGGPNPQEPSSRGRHGGGAGRADQPSKSYEQVKALVSSAVSKPPPHPASPAYLDAIASEVVLQGVTDADIHTAFLSVDGLAAANSIAEVFVNFAAEGGKIRDSPPLWKDLTERRGCLTLAALDVLLHAASVAPAPKRVDGASDTPTAHIAALIDALANAFGDLATTQRGCVALMRLVSLVHHVPRHLTAVVRGITGSLAEIIDGLHSPYVLGHMLSGLQAGEGTEAAAGDHHATPPSPRPMSPSAVLADQQASTDSLQRRRAAYIVDFANWLAFASTDSSSPEGCRNTCVAAVWTAFTEQLYQALRDRLAQVFAGRQQCFVLWHALRRTQVFGSTHGRLLLSDLADPSPRYPWPLSSTQTTEDASSLQSDLAHHTPSHNNNNAKFAALQVLCKSTAGRCAMVSLLARLNAHHEQDDQNDDVYAALRTSLLLLHESGIPAIDRRQEQTLKMRSGMEISSTLESKLKDYWEQRNTRRKPHP